MTTMQQSQTSPTPNLQQAGLPASSWMWWHTVGLISFVVLVATLHTMGPRVTLIGLALSLLGFAAIAGHGIKGTWRGMFIDERRMISLSRLQMLTWTVMVLSAYGAVALTRVGQSQVNPLEVAIPEELLLLIGISTTSLVGSPLIKNIKKDPKTTPQNTAQVLDNQRSGLSSEVTTTGQIVSKKRIGDASWADLFTGEEVANVTHLDLAKIQMFFFTVILVLSYGTAVWSLLECDTPMQCSIPSTLPGLSEGAVALLGISHGGYLLSKAVPTTSA